MRNHQDNKDNIAQSLLKEALNHHGQNAMPALREIISSPIA
jgi:hypothetical protein